MLTYLHSDLTFVSIPFALTENIWTYLRGICNLPDACREYSKANVLHLFIKSTTGNPFNHLTEHFFKFYYKITKFLFIILFASFMNMCTQVHDTTVLCLKFPSTECCSERTIANASNANAIETHL